MSILILSVLDIVLHLSHALIPIYIINTASKSKAITLLYTHFKLSVIASSIYCHPFTIYRWEGNI